MRVQLLIDVPTRELVAASYTKTVLENSGALDLSLEHQDICNRVTHYDFFERTREKQDVIVTPNYNVRRSRHAFGRAIRQQSKIVVQHSEQLFASVYDVEKMNLGNESAFRRRVSAHLVWGPVFARKLIKLSGIDPSTIYLAGNPKLDLARRSVRLRRLAAGSVERPKRVLIASNFDIGDWSEAVWEQFKRDYRADIRFPMNRLYREARDVCVQWLSRAATRFPNIEFLVRPHPGESLAAYQALAEFDNVKFGGDQEFSHDLTFCDAMFTYTSSSTFEAFATGVPVYSLDVMRVKEQEPYEPVHYGLLQWITETQFQALLTRLCGGGLVQLRENAYAEVSEYMVAPFGNTLLRNAIAYKHAARRAMNDKGWGVTDVMLGRVYMAIPFLKDMAIRTGWVTEKILGRDNAVTRWSRKQWERCKSKRGHLDPRMCSEANEAAKKIMSPREIEVVEKEEYELRQSAEGWHIDVPEDVDRVSSEGFLGSRESESENTAT